MNAELTLLRDFWTCWLALHSLTKRKDQEEAAQALVDCAHRLRIFYGKEHDKPRIQVVQ